MKKIMVTGLGIIFSIGALAEVNYLNCRDQIGNSYIDKTGRLVPTPPYDVVKREINGNEEKLEIGCDKKECATETVYLQKDDKGQVVGWIFGKKALTAGELEERKAKDLKDLEAMFFNSSPSGSNQSTLNYKDASGKIKTLDFDKMTEDEFKYFGLNKAINFQEFKNYRTLPTSYVEIEQAMHKAFKQMMSQQKKLYTEHAKGAKFKIKDNTCYPDSTYGLATSHFSGAKEQDDGFNADKCDEIVGIYNKYDKEIMQCDGISNNINMVLGDEPTSKRVGPHDWEVPAMQPILFKMAKYCKRLKEIEPKKEGKEDKSKASATKQ